MDNQKLNLEPTILVIFGITGDLAKRYLLPSLYHLVKYDQLHEKTEIIGLTRGDMQLDDLLGHIELCVSEADGVCDPEAVQKLKKRLTLRHMDVTKGESFDELKQHLDQIEDSRGVHMTRILYLSVPPAVTSPIITFLGEHELNNGCQHHESETRLLVEKPFGYNLASANELINETAKHFTENQIFRIDHYLAKETVENLLTFRFNNPIFEPLWNSHYVDYIEVLTEEKLGIEGRANFYEQTGAVRDLIQSHLLQVLALMTMEQPFKLESDAIHINKLQVMQQMVQVTNSEQTRNAIRGQYNGYKREVANDNSFVETYAAFRVYIENDRWNKVPMIVKTGKSLTRKLSVVNVVFKPTVRSPHHNILSFRISPDEGIELSLRVKKPGFEDEIQPVEMNFDYKTAFDAVDFSPTAYERVLVDAMRGSHALFATAQEIIESWRVVTPVVEEWAKDGNELKMYEPGSNGPDISFLYPDQI